MVNYVSIVFVSTFNLIAIYGLIVNKITLFDIKITLLMYLFTGFGITMGYHRLWAHKSYKASNIIQSFLALGGAGALQGSIIWWSRYHRLHHRKSDTDYDPYGPQKGFLYSHLLWIFEDRKIDALKNIDISDLQNNPIVNFQHKYYVFLSLFVAVGIPLIIYSCYNQPLYNCLLYGISLARFFVWHSTWFVNSLAHTLGIQTYGSSNSSRDHFITALLTLGEGYHNYHHEFPYDYRNGIKWYQYDPTKLLIKMFNLVGLTYDLKTKEDFINNIYNDYKKNITMTLNEYYDSEEELIVINDTIYNVSSLIDTHPGGSNFIKLIIRKNPKYILEMFNKINNHTNNAHYILNKLEIGKII